MQREQWMTMGFETTNHRQMKQQRKNENISTTEAAKATPTISAKELNPKLREQAGLDQLQVKQRTIPNSAIQKQAANKWQMQKVKRVLEQAQREGRSVEEVARERFTNIHEFHRLHAALSDEREEPVLHRFKRSRNDEIKNNNFQQNAVKSQLVVKKDISAPEKISTINQNSSEEIDLDVLNRFKGRILKSKLSGSSQADIARLESEYEMARKLFETQQKKKSSVVDVESHHRTENNCRFCISAKQQHNTTIQIVSQQLLPFKPLHAHHCLIVPQTHHQSILDCDEEEWRDIRRHMKQMVTEQAANENGVIFFETVLNPKQVTRHTFIQCVPVPFKHFDMAPAYFKQELLLTAGSNEEWSSSSSNHHTWIDTSIKGFRRSLVSKLPYFHVWFGLDKSYGHVIENVDRFPKQFAQSVIEGFSLKQ